ncbi:hypothetical protein PV08_02014 [Exophiala spinifera]|uniref:NADP-dependent oxidoreductase domain-containing protein n=1 Tax=Exophiala spinifera TaxID=91928 RepID=A0A0D2CD45_9EURO|nr:uncharacterized protein PV08_02014 [Exophiala spinifera]KIW21434.1 hypothetical protein PV08_02014 [Exophiala spinifera]
MATQQSQSLLSRYRLLSPSAAVFVSPICLGSMNFGTAYKAMMGECTKETAFEILDHYFGEGGNFIDTANSYHAGQSETWLGEWMAARGNRDQMVIATKYTGILRSADQGIQIRANYGGNGMKSLRLSVEESLKCLQTSYIDLLYVHWWNFTASIPEVMQALNDLVASGKVLYLGISDSPAWLVTKANQYARDHGLRQFVVYQGAWNAALRDFERDIVPMCREEGMGICPYGVLNSGRFQTEAAYKEREKHNPGRHQATTSSRDKAVAGVLEKLANAKKATLSNVALAYILYKAPYVFPIVGGRKLEHIKDNIRSLSTSLTTDEIDHIEKAYDFDPGFPHTFLSGTLIDGADAPQRGASHPSEVPWTRYQGTFDWVEYPKAIPLRTS